MGKNGLKHLQIIDITQLQQKNVGGISSDEDLIFVKTDYGPPLGRNFKPVGGGGGSNVDVLS